MTSDEAGKNNLKYLKIRMETRPILYFKIFLFASTNKETDSSRYIAKNFLVSRRFQIL